MKFEYLVVTPIGKVADSRDETVGTAFLNGFGVDEWQLVCIDPFDRYVFIRPLSAAVAAARLSEAEKVLAERSDTATAGQDNTPAVD